MYRDWRYAQEMTAEGKKMAALNKRTRLKQEGASIEGIGS
jgi:hypothetical protein